jgi:cation diffusion facilitator family transporter
MPTTLRTVVVAAAANLGIAVAKALAAVVTGSTSLWAEAAHSVADTGNEVLLFVGLRRSSHPADDAHPLGYGQERYFWAFLAAVGIFVIGGTLSIGQGLRSLLVPEPLNSFWVGIGVLAVSAVLEGWSWRTARRELRSGARRTRRSVRQHIVRTSDPTPATVFLEDSAALVGIAFALCALILHEVTGSAVWDSAGSIAIGVLLIVVAALLAGRSKALLLNEAAAGDVVEPIRALIDETPWVTSLLRLRAIYVGPVQLLVRADVSASAELTEAPGAELVRAAADLRLRLLDIPVVADAMILVQPEGG